MDLTSTEEHWVNYIREVVVPRLPGSSSKRARSAALVTWWALKEGILDQSNPWRHNICGPGDQRLGDLDVCTGPTWQIGMSGIQGTIRASTVEEAADRMYPGMDRSALLEEIAAEAGVDDMMTETVVSSTGALRKAWLLRDPILSFPLQAPFVERCLQGSAPSWCFGTWKAAKKFARSPSQISSIVDELEDRFDGGSPLRVLGMAMGLGLIGYGAWSFWRGVG